MFLWEFFSITARMIALALFTSAFVRYIGLVCLIHWASMTIWIVSMNTSFCDTPCEELGFNAVLGVIFIFCYFNPVDSATRYRYLLYYSVMFCENSTLMFLWTYHTSYQLWIKETALMLHYLFFFLGIILMVSYLCVSLLIALLNLNLMDCNYLKDDLLQMVPSYWRYQAVPRSRDSDYR